MKYPVGTRISITLDTDFDLSTADEVGIEYTRPNKGTGEWVGAVGEAGDTVVYTTLVTDVLVAGDWKFRAYAEIGAERKVGAWLIRTFE